MTDNIAYSHFPLLTLASDGVFPTWLQEVAAQYLSYGIPKGVIDVDASDGVHCTLRCKNEFIRTSQYEYMRIYSRSHGWVVGYVAWGESVCREGANTVRCLVCLFVHVCGKHEMLLLLLLTVDVLELLRTFYCNKLSIYPAVLLYRCFMLFVLSRTEWTNAVCRFFKSIQQPAHSIRICVCLCVGGPDGLLTCTGRHAAD